MKTHTSNFKNEIATFGRELDSVITYEFDGETIELGNEQLNSVSPHYEGAILKSVMKQLDIESTVEIPLETQINYRFGVKVRDDEVQDYRDNYDYIDYGNYIVYKSEKQEDTNSYKITCYDKMLYSMVKYENMQITYPITIRNYINTICNYLGLIFKNANDTFANYNKEIQNELFLDSEGGDLNYTFRDVLDQLAEATASTICLDANDQLEIRYVNNTQDTINEEYLKNINVNFGKKYGPINSIVLSRSAESDNVYLRDEESVLQDGLCELKIIDNQIMNWNDRSDYLQDILNQLDGLEYYLNDFASTGICYYDLCDRYNIQIGEETYSCIMFNDEVNITTGMEENIHTDMPSETQTDYTKADKTDRKINQTYLIVDKQNSKIESVVENVSILQNSTSQNADNINRLTSLVNSQGEEIDSLGTRITQTAENITASVSAIQGEIDSGVGLVKTTSVTIDDSGLNVSTDTSKISTTMTNNSFEIKDSGDKTLAFFGYDEQEGISKAEMDNLTVTNYFIAGVHRVETIEVDGEERTGYFYIGG
jgi:hypothetical protein